MLDRRSLLAAGALALWAFTAAPARAESAFEASPKLKALIVVDARLRHKTLLSSNESPVVMGGLRRRTPAKPGSREPEAHAIAGVLPFAVEPGRYRPGWVRARARRMQAGTGTVDLRIALPTDSLPQLAQTVEAGAVVYLGRIDILTLPRPFQENEYRIALAYDRDRERQVWEDLLAKTKTGPWEEAIRGRLAGLSAVSDTAGVDHWPPDDKR